MDQTKDYTDEELKLQKQLLQQRINEGKTLPGSMGKRLAPKSKIDRESAQAIAYVKQHLPEAVQKGILNETQRTILQEKYGVDSPESGSFHKPKTVHVLGIAFYTLETVPNYTQAAGMVKQALEAAEVREHNRREYEKQEQEKERKRIEQQLEERFLHHIGIEAQFDTPIPEEDRMTMEDYRKIFKSHLSK